MKPGLRTALAGLCLSAGTAWGAPITFNTALPVHEGGYVLREQFIFVKSADDPTPADRDMEVTGLVTVLGYGVTRDFALFAMLPLLDKKLDLQMAGQEVRRSQAGVSDLTVLGRYIAYEYNARGRTFRIAPFLGAKAPTGADDARDAHGRLPRPVQPGSGSWDVQGGVVLTWQTLDFQIDSQLSYKANGEANGFEAGDALSRSTPRSSTACGRAAWKPACPPFCMPFSKPIGFTQPRTASAESAMRIRVEPPCLSRPDCNT